MKYKALLLSCLLLSACSLFQRYPRPIHAPPEEAMRVQFPAELPLEGHRMVPGATAVAIHLAMDDFRPPDTQPRRGATPFELCLYRRDAFDVFTAPGPEGIVFVRFVFNPDACAMSVPVMDAGATYAIDVRGWRILAVE
jgi:hypothetical protein